MWYFKRPITQEFLTFHVRTNDCTYRYLFYTKKEEPQYEKLTKEIFESITDRCTFMDCSKECALIVKRITSDKTLDLRIISLWLRGVPYTLQDVRANNPFVYHLISQLPAQVHTQASID